MKVQSFGLVAGALMTAVAGATAVAKNQPVDRLGEVRTVDGTGNNRAHPAWGSAGIPLLRRAPAAYDDGTGSPAGARKAGAREVSNACIAQRGPIPNSRRASDFMWQWGQFIDHDLDMTPSALPAEPFNIAVPAGDPFFDPLGQGSKWIGLDRSAYLMDAAGVRQQITMITAFIDASMVYGSDADRAMALRALDGSGRLKTSPGDLLPFNETGFPNGPSGTDPTHFLAGDQRANEQLGLTSMQTLFVREHNFWADQFRQEFEDATDEDLYQWARAIVAAEVQRITFEEWLPVFLGPGALAPYTGYNPTVNPGIETVFSTAAFRVGHTMLSPMLLRLDKHGRPIPAGNIALRESFLNPPEIIAHGIDPLLRGLATQPAQEVDMFIVDDVRNFLFGPPGAGGFDLASLNIQRGRDHGLPGYNAVRAAYGLPPKARFAEMNPEPEVQARLAAVYVAPDDVDLWVGGLCESHAPGAMVGETFFAIIRDQFQRLRDGDRFWYQVYLPQPLQKLIEKQSLADIIRRNTDIRGELQKNVFLAP